MSDLRLRPMEPEDLDVLYRIENDPELWGVSATTVPYSRFALHEYIASATGDIFVDRQVRLMIENGAGEVVGLADLFNFDPKHCRAEVGLVIQRSHRKKGYATLAMNQLEQHALHVLHLHQLYAFVGCDNEPSQALFRSLDYQKVGPIVDWLYDGSRYHSAVLFQKLLAPASEL